MKLTTIVTIGKSLSIKCEKSEAGESTVAHLKFGEMFIQREQINEIAGQRPGWAETSFFDEQGAPLGHWCLSLSGTALFVTGKIRGKNAAQSLCLVDSNMSGIKIALIPLGAMLYGNLSWQISGDEVGDIEPLLGRECSAELTLSDGGQKDMLKEGAA